jgi:hypothetical protein
MRLSNQNYGVGFLYNKDHQSRWDRGPPVTGKAGHRIKIVRATNLDLYKLQSWINLFFFGGFFRYTF